MGWALTTEREFHRVEVLQAVQAGRRTVTAAAQVLLVAVVPAPGLVIMPKDSPDPAPP